MKISGAEFKAFMAAWPQGHDWYHEDGDIETDEDGEYLVADDAKIDLWEAIGCVMWQGKGSAPASITLLGQKAKVDPDTGLDILPIYRAWKKGVVVLNVVCPTDKADALREAIAAAGGKIIN